jgi:flagellin
MTRINTNVSSLVAQNTLGRSNASLNQALTRLSTGLRINTGKDDPAGLIASENLRSDITSIQRAISNTDRANQVIATADSALGQVSSLLNDIRGLVTESANDGALSPEQLAANQLQVDSSLEALNRIAQTTTFQGRRLLDGSLDFLTTAGSNFTKLSDLKIDQANLGATGSVTVDVEVTTAATKAAVNNTNIPAAVTGVNSVGSITFDDAAVASTGTIQFATTEKQATGTATLDSGDVLTITALDGGIADGASGNDIDLVFVQDGTNAGALNGVTFVGTTITVNGDFTTGVASNVVAAAIDAVNGGTDLNVTSDGTADVVAADVAATYNNLTSGGSDSGTQTITITGTAGAASNVAIQVVEAAGIGATPTVTGDADSGYIIRVDSGNQNTTLAAIATAIQSIAEVATATASTPAAIYNGSTDSSLNAAAGVSTTLTGGDDAGSDIIQIIGNTSGDNNRTLAFVDTANLGDGVISVTDDGTTLTINLDDTSAYDLSDIVDAINDDEDVGAIFTASLIQNEVDGQYDAATDTAPAGADLVGPTGGVAASGGLSAAVVLELAGINGSEVVSFGAGTSIADLVAGINLLSDATGVEASIGAVSTTLVLESSAYGSAGVVDLKVISEGSGSTPSGLFTSTVGSGTRDAGTDVAATINGVVATGDGNQITINTATLDLSTTLEAEFTGTASFTITGGGALFQLGPDVVSNQQARLGIGSVNTARLGGVSGKLFQLGTGGTASLSSDNLDTAASIVEEAINQVTSLRGRLGAFQRTTLETNKQALNDTLVNLTDAESTIRDADFASETAALTRAQILVQSGTTVLQIANSNPQNVLALLRG